MNIYIIDLESVPTRYTCEWKDHIPQLLKEKAPKGVNIINISGGDEIIPATPGAFLNFQATNIYKNNQLNDIARRFTTEIKPGDKFLFTDAWHPGIIELKYMSELLNIPVEIHALWHAGSYDPQDFLGRLIKDKRWTNNFEKSVFHAVDCNWFATQFHIDMFKDNVFGKDNILYELSDEEINNKFCKTGWPMEYMTNLLDFYKDLYKKDLILFPHRIAPEKQVEIFKDLASSMPQYEFVVCQEQNLSKAEYHELLGQSKMVFSANLQETLGISCFEGAVVGSMPLVPNRLSYTEMYSDFFSYPSEWTASFDDYLVHKDKLIDRIKTMMEGYDANTTYKMQTNYLAQRLQSRFFSASKLTESLFM